MAINQQVIVSIKVVDVKAATNVISKSGKKLQMQECIVSDESGVCRLVLWENDVHRLKVDECYKVENVMVRMFQDRKHLSMSESSVVKPIADLGEVASMSIDEGEVRHGGEVVEGEIVAVLSADEYRTWMKCKGKVFICSDVVGECTKCGAKLKLHICGLQQMAKIVIEDEGGEHTLTLFGEQLEGLLIHEVGDGTADKLLSINAVRVEINQHGIATFAKIV